MKKKKQKQKYGTVYQNVEVRTGTSMKVGSGWKRFNITDNDLIRQY